MGRCLADFVYDPKNQEIRSRNRAELARAILLVSLFLSLILLFCSSLFGLNIAFSFFGLLPITLLAVPVRKKVLIAKRGDKIFYNIGEAKIEMKSTGNIHCKVIRSCGDCFDAKIRYGDSRREIIIFKSPDFVAEEDFKTLFQAFFEDLTYEYVEEK